MLTAQGSNVSKYFATEPLFLLILSISVTVKMNPNYSSWKSLPDQAKHQVVVKNATVNHRTVSLSLCTNIDSQRQGIRKDTSRYFTLVAFLFLFPIYCLFHIYDALNKKGAIKRHNWKIQKKTNTERQKKIISWLYFHNMVFVSSKYKTVY